MNRDLSHHHPRTVNGDQILATKQALGFYLERSPDLVRRHCEPVACDVRSRALLYDAEDVENRLALLPRREQPAGKRVSRSAGSQPLVSGPRLPVSALS